MWVISSQRNVGWKPFIKKIEDQGHSPQKICEEIKPSMLITNKSTLGKKIKD